MDAGTPAQDTLEAIARENITNLREFDYFTTIHVDGQAIPLGKVRRFETTVRDNRFWMRFEIPLLKPIDPTTHDVTFAVYDPTYYIEIAYTDDGEPVQFDGQNNRSCYADIIPPAPSTEVIGLAVRLDQTQSGGDTLGQHFAETVKILCK